MGKARASLAGALSRHASVRSMETSFGWADARVTRTPAETLAPPELLTRLRRCADSHLDVCVGKHDVKGAAASGTVAKIFPATRNDGNP